MIGIGGKIGRALADSLRKSGYQVTGTDWHEGRNEGAIHLDLAERKSTDVKLPIADVAFFCAAISTYKACRDNEERALLVNATHPVAIADRLVELGTRVILLSTSAVLDCKSPRMLADRPRNPASAYGRTKAAGEEGFLALGRHAAILRLTKVVRPSEKRFKDWKDALIAGRPIDDCPNDLRFSPLTTEHVVSALMSVAEHDQGGMFQVSASSDLSYAESAKHLARRLKVSDALVLDKSAADLNISPDEVTAYTSLDTSRLSTMSGFVPPDPLRVLDQAMDPIVDSFSRAAAIGP